MAFLGILLAASKELSRAIRYAKAARALGHEVGVFVTFEAVSVLGEPAVDALVQEAQVIACAQTVQQQKINVRPGIVLGSQFDHAELADKADCFLSLTG